MFIWFVMRDSAGSPWQSGIYRTTGSPKPAQPRFATAARPLNPVNGKLSVKGGTKNPAVTVYLRHVLRQQPGRCAGSASRRRRSSAARRSPIRSQQLTLGSDCTIAYRVTGLTVAKGKTYTVTADANTAKGDAVTRTITIVGT